MKKYLLILLIIVFSLLFVCLAKNMVLAQFPSFEIYNSSCSNGVNCTPYPEVDSPVVTKNGNTVIITVHAFDVSGIEPLGSVVAKIEDPNNSGKYMNSEYSISDGGLMHDDGSFPEPGNPAQANDGWYGLTLDVSDTSIWAPGTYWVDISATDNLHNNSLTESSNKDYAHVGSFTIYSTDAKLSGLTISQGALSPTFSSSTTSYTDSVGNSISSITITPIVNQSGATITVNGTAVTSGSASGSISLAVGANAIPIVVTAQDGATRQTYTITITRAASNDATLKALTISSGSLSPTFSSSTTSYTDSVGNGVSSMTVTPTANQANATIKVNGTTVTSGSASGSISLAVGSNSIPVVVTAQDGVTIYTYTITVTRISNDATLNNLTISSGSLSPTFSSSTTSYTDNVGSSAGSVTVTPTTNQAGATIKVNGTAVNSGSASNPILLSVGSNTITIVVTAQDGTTTDTYTIIVTSSGASDATLKSLTISSGSLSPAFSSGAALYTDNVGNSTSSITVTPTVNESHATIKVNGTTVTSGTASGAISLSIGSNTITIVVTAQDGVTTDTYTITVNRLSSDATLSALVISSGTLTPTFSSGTISYTDSVVNSVTSITVTPTATQSSGATITVNGATVTSGSASGPVSLSVGSNTVTVLVTAPDGVTTKTYTITVTRLSNDATLSSLTISSGSLSPTFSSSTTSYTDSVANSVTSVTVTPTRNESHATIKVNGTTVTSGTASGAISLNMGPNTITIVVTAQDGTTNTYIITANRVSNDATLSGLGVSPGTLIPAFASGTTSYIDNIGTSGTSVSITPTSTNANATITINGTSASSGFAYGPISLNTGSNMFTITVTAQDQVTTKTYILAVLSGNCVTTPSGSGAGATICIATPPANSSQISSLTLNGSSSPSSVSTGTAIALVATLSAGANAQGEVVYFTDSTATPYNLGSAIVDAIGKATFNYTATVAGNHTYTAVYNGNINSGFTASTKSVSLTVTGLGGCVTTPSGSGAGATICIATPPANSSQISSLTLNGSSSPSSVSTGTAIALVATLSAGANAQGEVVYFTDSTATPYNLGSAIVDAIGKATFNYTATVAGNHTYTAVYNGNINSGFTASTKSVSLTVTGLGGCVTTPSGSGAGATICIATPPANSSQISSLTLNGSSSPSSVSTGTAIALVATLSAGANAQGEVVYFTDSTATPYNLGSAIVDAIGKATFNYTATVAGNHTYTAVYNGNINSGFTASTKSVSLTVTGLGGCVTTPSGSGAGATICIATPPANSSQISLLTINGSSSPGSITHGTQITLVATLAAGANAQGEVVYFRDTTATPYNIGSAVVTSAGTATFNYTPATAGTYTYTAVYNGNINSGFTASTKTVTQVVN